MQRSKGLRLFAYTVFVTVYGLLTALLFSRIVLQFNPDFFTISSNPSPGSLSGLVVFFFAVIATTYLASEVILRRFFHDENNKHSYRKTGGHSRPVRRRKKDRSADMRYRPGRGTQGTGKRSGTRTRISDGPVTGTRTDLSK